MTKAIHWFDMMQYEPLNNSAELAAEQLPQMVNNTYLHTVLRLQAPDSLAGTTTPRATSADREY
jgi:hypothetical protein